MKFSENWLRDWVNPEWDSNTLAEELSLAGLEVDGIEPVAGDFTNVVVGHVVSMEKHPDADKLNVTQVNVGEDELLQIVCGAKNVQPGQKVCCAKVGAKLPGDFKIKKAKLRGVPSHGMLCGATEIGLPDDGVDGLHLLPEDAPIGMDIREYLDLNDVSLDVDLTPNRADCFSVLGIARDVHAISGAAFTTPFTDKDMAGSTECSVDIEVADSQACPKYLGCVVSNYNNQAQTPDWVKQRLERSGIRSLGLVVDITNYVLLELGQPMHAFDLAKLQGAVQIRFANEGEKLVTLDEKELTLSANTLVIADDSGAIALAGVMGGLSTSVTDDTTSIFFECAHFNRLTIIGKARQYGLHTDSSMRFERGVDPLLPERALNRALALFTEIAGGEISQVKAIVDETNLQQAQTISLRSEWLEKRLGFQVADDEVVSILTRLGCEVATTENGWSVKAPSYRFDMTIEMDLVEEVGRVYGYNRMPEVELVAPVNIPESAEEALTIHTFKNALVTRGFNEIITYSFVSEDKQTALEPNLPQVLVKNPISEDMKVMRTNLLPGLLQTVAYNQNRQQSRVRVFETGLTFVKDDADSTGAKQTPCMGGAITGKAKAASWIEETRNVDFFDAKGEVEALFAVAGQLENLRFEKTSHPALHPGQAAAIVLNGEEVGFLGQLHPQHQKTMDVNGEVFVFQVLQSALLTKPLPQAKPISKFPEVQRDLAFVIDEETTVQALVDAMTVESEILKSIDLFDVYRGQGVDENKKSIALNLRMQHQERTLLDEEIDSLMAQVIEQAKAVNAVLR